MQAPPPSSDSGSATQSQPEAPPSNEPLVFERVISAPLAQAWNAWATRDGLLTFFAVEARVQMVAGGAYEPLFSMEEAEGLRGAEGCTVVSFLPERQLTVTWNFPPTLPLLRSVGARTRLVLEFEPMGAAATKVRIRHEGWSQKPGWAEGRAYFEKAWPLVLARLERRFRRGPLDVRRRWAPGSPAELAWMQGSWRRFDGIRLFEEHWSAAPGGLMGMYRELKDGNPIFYELAAIEQEGVEVVLSLRMFEPGLVDAARTRAVPLRLFLEEHGPERALFAGDGLSICYERRTGVLQVTVERAGVQPERFFYKRIGA